MTNFVVLAMFFAGTVYCQRLLSVLPQLTTRAAEMTTNFDHAVRTCISSTRLSMTEA